MTKMVATPIQGKSPLYIIIVSEIKKPMGLQHAMQRWECGLYQDLTNDDSGLTKTYFTMATMPIYEACIGELPVSYIPGIKQESILYPFK